ncbi:uncharacterized protein TRUGW13939_03495 [Talaromyces rugulosus]|uniref:Glycosyltransferase family 69 protein n=1 Tax=Talaromyces rugulosus TaxID=121627 RepID=A0A7H8QR74_TALRU|nr:uncharacterized protein TRUGW13939_03495 [Talaromyces rugulosus]QKX56392.1 hypothetical protein TRUGW13939_03495 [Talaromyces rugulosus]
MPVLNIRMKRYLARLALLAIIFLIFDLFWAHFRGSPSDPLQSRNNQGYTPSKTKSTTQERIFIASTHWNNEIVLRSHWNTAILNLVQSLGAENVYVSVVESGSYDNTKGALIELDYYLAQLGINRTISLSEASHLDAISREPEEQEEGWVDTPRGRRELRRIPFLSRERNESLKPLAGLKTEFGLKFDKILFLNDVVFTNDDFYTLLDTNHGSYAAACALDFAKPPAFYDTFALRDSEGNEAMMQTWPYFRGRASRLAMERNEIVPVKSCWNSMVIMDSTPFYDRLTPLQFRGIPDSLATHHLEGSECCLIHADNPLTNQKGVWLNPHVRVAYSGKAYEAVHPSSTSAWTTSWQRLTGRWENRVRRWFTSNGLKSRIVFNRLRSWQRDTYGAGEKKKKLEPGGFCLVDETHVIVDIGWAHV